MSLECLEDTEVFFLLLEDYKKLCNDLQKMEHSFIEKANFSFIASQRRIISWLTSNAKERYEQPLKQYPSLIQAYLKAYLLPI